VRVHNATTHDIHAFPQDNGRSGAGDGLPHQSVVSWPRPCTSWIDNLTTHNQKTAYKKCLPDCLVSIGLRGDRVRVAELDFKETDYTGLGTVEVMKNDGRCGMSESSAASWALGALPDAEGITTRNLMYTGLELAHYYALVNFVDKLNGTSPDFFNTGPGKASKAVCTNHKFNGSCGLLRDSP